MIIINKVVLLGRLTKDPELRYAVGSGTAVCRFTVAINRQLKKNETDFINCIAFGKTGETITQYFTKGSKIAITGNIRTGSYDAKDGTKRYTTDVIVETFELVESKKKETNEFDKQASNFPDPFTKEHEEPVFEDDMPFN